MEGDHSRGGAYRIGTAGHGRGGTTTTVDAGLSFPHTRPPPRSPLGSSKDNIAIRVRLSLVARSKVTSQNGVSAQRRAVQANNFIFVKYAFVVCKFIRPPT